MKNSTSKTSILKDAAVFDYVAGKMSKEQQENFEKLLGQDGGLVHEVEIERQLRSNLEEVSKTDAEPVSMKNFDVLLESIENAESELSSDDGVIPDNDNKVSNVVISQPWRWQKQMSIAASVAFVAMIGFIGFNQTTQPDFITLSDKEASSEINFLGLVDQHRLVKLELSDGLAPTDFESLLERFELRAIESGITGSTVLVSADTSVDQQKVSDLLADKRIVNVELVSFDTE